MDDTIVLTTLATGDNDRTKTSFHNLTVDYKQRHHGVGKIPLTTASRRDNARSTTLETLASRAIDRALRPLLISNLDCSLHVQSSVQGCSSKGGNPVVASINSASAALMSHDLLQEPVAAVCLGVVAGGPKVLVNPSNLARINKEDVNEQPLVCELLYAGTRSKAVMAEFQYHRYYDSSVEEHPQTSIPEKELAQLMTLAQAAIQPLLDTQEEFILNNKQSAGEPEVEITKIEEENEIRASLGLQPLPEDDSTELATEDVNKQKADELFDEALEFCERQLQQAALALFGYSDGKVIRRDESERGPSQYQNAYIHPDASSLLSKATRGRREQIVHGEIERVLRDWVSQEHYRAVESEEEEAALVSVLAGKVHKMLLQKALCTTATEYGTRADQRVGGVDLNAACGIQTIRPLSVTVPALPEVVHGSAIFARGETQVLCTATLGAPRDGIPIRDPFQPPLPTPRSQSDYKTGGGTQEERTAFQDLPVGSLRYLRTQEALESDLNTRKSKADREMTGDSGSLWENQRAYLQYDFPAFSTGELPAGGGMLHNRRAIGNTTAPQAFMSNHVA